MVETIKIQNDYQSISDALFKEYIPRADSLARKYLLANEETPFVNIDDLTQEAYTGLAKAIDMRYNNPTSGIPLHMSVDTQIKRRLDHYVLKQGRCDETLNTQTYVDERMENPEELVEKSNLVKRVHKAIDSMPGRKQHVVCMKYGIGDSKEMNFGEIAELDGTSGGNVGGMNKQGIGYLKRKLRDVAIDYGYKVPAWKDFDDGLRRVRTKRKAVPMMNMRFW